MARRSRDSCRNECRAHSRVATTLTCFGGAAAQRPKRKEHVDHDRHTLRCSERAESCRMATWESRAGRTELKNQRPPRTTPGRGSEWSWSVQQTTRQRVSAGRTTVDDRGNRAVQNPTKGAEYRPSRQRLSDETFPATHKSGHTHTRHGGVHDHAEKCNDEPEQASSGGNSLYTRRARRGETVGWGLPDHEQHASEHAESNTWVSTWRGEGILETGITLRRRCEFGARGARQTHSQAATPGSEHSSNWSQQSG